MNKTVEIPDRLREKGCKYWVRGRQFSGVAEAVEFACVFALTEGVDIWVYHYNFAACHWTPLHWVQVRVLRHYLDTSEVVGAAVLPARR